MMDRSSIVSGNRPMPASAFGQNTLNTRGSSGSPSTRTTCAVSLVWPQLSRPRSSSFSFIQASASSSSSVGEYFSTRRNNAAGLRLEIRSARLADLVQQDEEIAFPAPFLRTPHRQHRQDIEGVTAEREHRPQRDRIACGRCHDDVAGEFPDDGIEQRGALDRLGPSFGSSRLRPGAASGRRRRSRSWSSTETRMPIAFASVSRNRSYFIGSKSAIRLSLLASSPSSSGSAGASLVLAVASDAISGTSTALMPHRCLRGRA